MYMIFKFKSLFLFLIITSLYGCGGGSSDDSFEIYGTWQYDTEFSEGVAVIKEGTMIDYVYSELSSCYLAQSSLITNITENTITIVNEEGQTFNGSWSITSNSLSIDVTGQGSTLLTPSSTNISELTFCPNIHADTSINISVTFQNLPEAILVNRESTPDSRVDYNFEVEFDINNNGVSDVGDIEISLSHVKRDNPSPIWLDINELETGIFQIAQIDDEGTRHLVSIGNIEYSVNEDSFDISATFTNLASDLSNSNVKVASYYLGENNTNQRDIYPDSGYTSGIDITSMQDNSDDVLVFGGDTDNIIVDIEEVRITFTE